MRATLARGVSEARLKYVLSRNSARHLFSLILGAVAIATALLAPLTTAQAASLCATPKQASDIQTEYAKHPGVPPFEIAKVMSLPEETVITGLPDTQNVGTSDGRAFAKIWESLAEWERPTVAILLPNDNIVEVVGPIGTVLNENEGTVKIESLRMGVGGHFHLSSIAAIHSVAIPRNNKETLYGTIFLAADGRSIISVYSMKAAKPALIQFLSPDAYQKTRDMISTLPRHCP